MKLSQTKIDLIYKNLDKGYSQRKVAQMLHMGRRTVKKYLVQRLITQTIKTIHTNIDWGEARKYVENRNRSERNFRIGMLMIATGLILLITYFTIR